MRVTHASAERLEVEVTYHAVKLPPAHRHPHQDESFEVLEGHLRVVLDGENGVLGPGERVEIPRGVVHRMAAADTAGATVRWTTRPALRTQGWFRALDAANRRHDGHPPPLVLLRLVVRYRDVLRPTRPRRARNDSQTHAP